MKKNKNKTKKYRKIQVKYVGYINNSNKSVYSPILSSVYRFLSMLHILIQLLL